MILGVWNEWFFHLFLVLGLFSFGAMYAYVDKKLIGQVDLGDQAQIMGTGVFILAETIHQFPV